MVAADEAGSSSAAAFSALAQIARWRHRYEEAADLAAAGFDCCPPTSLRVLLACQEANAAAVAGQASRAQAAIARAEAIVGNYPAAEAAWSCPPGRYALYRLGVTLNLGHPNQALRQAAETKSLWPAESPRLFGSWAHFQIAVANAHLILGSVDEAAHQLAPVLELPSEYRLATLAEHATTIGTILQQHRFRDSAQAAAVRAQIVQFATYPQ